MELLAKELARTTVLAQETFQHASAHHAACVATATAMAEHVGGGAAPKPLPVTNANGARRPRAGSGAAPLALKLCSAAVVRAARASPAGAPQLQRRIDASAQGAAPAMDVRGNLNIVRNAWDACVSHSKYYVVDLST